MSAPASAVDAPATPDLLAASILAVFTMVRADLTEAPPQVGRIAEQAGAAFGRHEHEWLSLSCGDVAGWLPADRAAGRARLFLSGFGAHLNLAAARALDVGMQMQLSRGWHPDVAWQRALAGYGLDERAMRGYVGAAMAASAQAGAVVADPVRARVERALCEYAQRCAADAARAAQRSTTRVLRRVDAAPPVAGLAVRARDTGRLLMLQRALDPADPAGGTWEFPGGHAEPGETPGAAAVREWQEEVGRRLPPVTPAGTWRHGPYVGIVADIDREADIPIGRGRGSIVNPDDPDRDAIEQLAWWDVDQLARNPAVRAELRASLAKVRAALGEVAKRFYPGEPRDQRGRWIRTVGDHATVAASLNAMRRPYTEVDVGARLFGAQDARQVADRERLITQGGPDMQRLARAVDRWVGMRGVRQARKLEAGLPDRGPARVLRTHHDESLRFLMDTVDAAPSNAPMLYRGLSMDAVPRVGSMLTLPLSSFSHYRPDAERFLDTRTRRQGRNVLLRVLPGAKALNLSPLATQALSANEYVTRGDFRVVSVRRGTRDLPGNLGGETRPTRYTLVTIRPVAYRSNSLTNRQLRRSGRVSKAGFDPREPRDRGGRWTDQGRAPRRATKERVRDDTLDAILSGPVAEEQPAKRSYQQRNYRQYRTYQPERNYAAERDFAAERDYRPERIYGGERTYQEPSRRTVVHHLVVLLGKKTVQRPEPEGDDLPDRGHGLYLPMSDVGDYFGGELIWSDYRSTVNLAHVRSYRDAGGDDEPIEAQESRTPWSVVAAAPDVDPARWDALVRDAAELAGRVDSDPLAYADRLSDPEIDYVAERAGYPAGDHRLFRQLIREAVQRREDEQPDLDPSLINALVDYYVWVNPYKMGTDGKAFARNASFVMHTDDIGDSGVAPVFKFNSLAPGEDMGDMHGHYGVHHIEYLSGILSGERMPPGVFGIQVIELQPTRKN